jgi:rhamnosyltransferase subunit B
VAAGQAIGARIAQEKLGVPLTTVHLSPFFFRSTYRNRRVPGLVIPDFVPRNWKQALFRAADFAGDWAYGGAVNEFRSSLGLKPANAIFWDWWNSPQLILALFPEWFAPPQPDWPPQTQLAGFPLYDPRQTESISAELAAFLADGACPVVFTPGTAMAHANDFFATSLRAVELLGCRAVFVSQFSEHLPRNLPDSVTTCRYAPFGALLPRAAAIVHHGGIGSIAQAMAAGLPQLIMPHGFDQPENASRIVELGIGAQIAQRRYSVRRVVRELGKLLLSADLRSRCHELAARFPGFAQLDVACCAIEKLTELAPHVRRDNSTPRVTAARNVG